MNPRDLQLNYSRKRGRLGFIREQIDLKKDLKPLYSAFLLLTGIDVLKKRVSFIFFCSIVIELSRDLPYEYAGSMGVVVYRPTKFLISEKMFLRRTHPGVFRKHHKDFARWMMRAGRHYGIKKFIL